MVRRQFDEQLAELKDLLTRMGELNCEAIGDAVTALETQDSELARRTKGVERLVDEKEQQIERLCLKIILKQQPVASDLLFVTSAMKMITDMERIADPMMLFISELRKEVKALFMEKEEVPPEAMYMPEANMVMAIFPRSSLSIVFNSSCKAMSSGAEIMNCIPGLLRFCVNFTPQ